MMAVTPDMYFYAQNTKTAELGHPHIWHKMNGTVYFFTASAQETLMFLGHVHNITRNSNRLLQYELTQTVSNIKHEWQQ